MNAAIVTFPRGMLFKYRENVQIGNDAAYNVTLYNTILYYAMLLYYTILYYTILHHTICIYIIYTVASSLGSRPSMVKLLTALALTIWSSRPLTFFKDLRPSQVFVIVVVSSPSSSSRTTVRQQKRKQSSLNWWQQSNPLICISNKCIICLRAPKLPWQFHLGISAKSICWMKFSQLESGSDVLLVLPS